MRRSGSSSPNLTRLRLFALLALALSLSCVSKPATREAPPVAATNIKLEPKDGKPEASPAAADAKPASDATAQSATARVANPEADAKAAADAKPAAELSLTARIEKELAFASPSSLSTAEDLIRANKAQDSEFGRAVLYVSYQLRKRLYPETLDPAASLDPPPLNLLVRTMQETEKGRYPDPALRSASRLTGLLSTTVLFAPQDAETSRSALADLAKIGQDPGYSILIPFFTALDAERAQDWNRALAQYQRAEALAADCYPASLGRVRVLFGLKRRAEAVSLLESLAAAHPNSVDASRLLAQAYYDSGRYDAAAPIIQNVLRAEPTNDAFIAMRAHILILSGNYLQAGPLLDAYATRNPHDPLYLYLRGLFLWKEDKQRARAVDFLKGAAVLYPRDQRLSLLLAEVLLDGDDPSSQDRQTARGLLESILALDADNQEAMIFLARDALAVGNSQRAQAFLDGLLAVNADFKEYGLMTEIAFAAKQYKRASAWADAWFAASPSDEDAALAKARSLIETGRGPQALALVTERLAKHPAAKFSAALFFLRSRLQKDPDDAMSDLRSSLMDDPRNLDSILAMFDAYYGQKDYKKAQFYLRQAQAASPSNAEVASRTKTLGNLASQ
jgi:predicted Zn-dependent protease